MANTLTRLPFIIGVAGGTCCGKSQVCNKIVEAIDEAHVESKDKRVLVIGQESFYRNLTNEESVLAEAGEFNFDHPDAFDEDLALTTLTQLQKREIVKIQKYNFKTHSRESGYVTLYPADVILLEGILVLYSKALRQLMDMRIFVDTDSDTRLARRVTRDTMDHGRDIDSVLNQYTRFVKPAFEDFTLPTKKYADVILPRGADNTVAIGLIVQHIKDILAGSQTDVNFAKRKRIKSESNSFRPH